MSKTAVVPDGQPLFLFFRENGLYLIQFFLFLLFEKPISHSRDFICIIKGIHVLAAFAIVREDRPGFKLKYVDRRALLEHCRCKLALTALRES